MELVNYATPIPSIPPQPAESPNRRWLLWSIGGVTLLIVGISIGFFSAKFLNKSQSQSQLPTPSSAQSPTPTPTPDPTADWKTYTNSKYNFVFKHPNLDEKCCGLAGALSDNPTAVITLADITTVIPNTDAPFDGLSVYIILNENGLSLDQYIEKEKTALFEQFKVMADPNMTHKGRVIRTTVADQPAVSLVDYSWDGITRTYFKHLTSKVIIEISKKDQTPNHFSSYDQILSTFKFTDNTSSAPTSTTNPKKLTYYLPPGWKTVQSSNRSFEVSYNPDTTRADVNSYVQDGISLFKENFTNAAYFTVRLMSYSGGSRHQFLYNYLGEKPVKEDLMPNYHETEYLYDGKSCLFLVGISISQFPTTFGMCDAGGGKAFLITSFDNENYEEPLRTIKPL